MNTNLSREERENAAKLSYDNGSNIVEKAELQYKEMLIDEVEGGSVTLIDAMGDDYAVTQAARVSYGNDRNEIPPADDQKLIRYLFRHRHTTPFEMCELKIRVRCPMDLWRQWIRHRTASVNEYSTRYVPAIDDRQTTPEEAWRLQARNNKQGSSGLLEEWPEGYRNIAFGGAGYVIETPDKQKIPSKAGETPGQYLSRREREFHKQAQELYQERLALGVAREQARKDLPLSTFTEAYWKCNLHNCLHFLGLRMDSHAQLEIRAFANMIGNEIIAKLYPTVWKAFEMYRRNALFLTELDLQVMADLSARNDDGEITLPIPESEFPEDSWPVLMQGTRNRERDECLEKLKRIRFVD